MTLGKIVARISRRQPMGVIELLDECHLPLKFLGGGAYRKVYEIVGSGFVVKVPHSKGDIPHATTEFLCWRKIIRSKRKYAALHPYMPVFRYHNKVSGITVMDMYETDFDYNTHEPEMTYINNLTQDVMKNYDNDLEPEKWDNYGLDAKGELKIIDLGYFSESGL